jgi:hypothetical protein
MAGRIFDLVNNQTLQAKNSCMGVETATFYALERFTVVTNRYSQW